MFLFGDGFDFYTTTADGAVGYWDSMFPTITLVAGRLAGRCLQFSSSGSNFATKTSNQNDAVHHFTLAINQTAALSGTTLGVNINLLDGASIQCSVVFRSDGAILLTSGGATGSILATYIGAITTANQWYVFEIEVVISNTAGSFTVRTNGSVTNNFQATGLNTRGGSTNNYANKITINQQATINAQLVDDFLWRSDPSAVPWIGDVRTYQRTPNSDVQKQFSLSAPNSMQISTSLVSSNGSASPDTVYWSPSPGFTAPVTGTVAGMRLDLSGSLTGHARMALYQGGASPGALLGVTNPITNPVAGVNIFTFTTPIQVTALSTYYAAILFDMTIIGLILNSGIGGIQQYSVAQPYSSGFPSSPAGLTNNGNNSTFHSLRAIFGPSNYTAVTEQQQDGANTYVSGFNVGDNDLYRFAGLVVAPVSIVAVTTRAFMQRANDGSRFAAVQVKSGNTVVQSPATLPVSGSFSCVYRTDLTDPNTSAAWQPAAVNNLQIGPVVVAS